MKFLLALTFSFFATAAMACTDFTGNYIDQVGGAITYEQSGCESITRTGEGKTETLITDGVERVLQENNYYRISATAIFEDGALKVVDHIFYKVALPGTPPEKIPALVNALVTKSSNGDVTSTMTSYNAGGQVIQNVVALLRKI